MTDEITAQAIIDNERKCRRELGTNVPRYAIGNGGTCIGAWSEELGRWVTIVGLLIGGKGWASLPYELLVNGEPPKVDWVEVHDPVLDELKVVA